RAHRTPRRWPGRVVSRRRHARCLRLRRATGSPQDRPRRTRLRQSEPRGEAASRGAQGGRRDRGADREGRRRPGRRAGGAGQRADRPVPDQGAVPGAYREAPCPRVPGRQHRPAAHGHRGRWHAQAAPERAIALAGMAGRRPSLPGGDRRDRQAVPGDGVGAQRARRRDQPVNRDRGAGHRQASRVAARHERHRELLTGGMNAPAADAELGRALPVYAHLQERARAARSLRELWFTIANETWQLLPYAQAYLWQADGGAVRLRTAAGLAQLAEDSPLTVWLRRLGRWLERRVGDDPEFFAGEDMPAELVE